MGPDYVPLDQRPKKSFVQAADLDSTSKLSYGVPTKKSSWNAIDVLALMVSYLCCALCFVVVAPSLPLAWTLGFNSQIVALGFLISIMTICNKRIATRFLVSVEIRWGNSALQNLEAILGSSIFIPKSDLVCRVAILLLSTLPLVLSASYKTFSGGSAMNTVTDRPIVEYGAFSRPLVEGSQQSYSLIDTMSAFKQASLTQPSPPPIWELPKPYGYNIVLLSNKDVALLDMPNSTILEKVQSKLGVSESMILSAEIRGTLARYNSSTPELLGSDDFWKIYMNRTTTMTSHRKWRMAFTSGLHPTVWAAIGGYWNTDPERESELWIQDYFGWAEPEVTAFRRSIFAMIFDIYRVPCSATWEIVPGEVHLLSASCEISRARIIKTSMLPTNPNFQVKAFVDAVPFGIFEVWPNKTNHPWTVPLSAMTVAAIHQNRWKHMLQGDIVCAPDIPFVREVSYNTSHEIIRIKRDAVRAKVGLYLVFATLPLLSTAMWLVNVYLYSTPITSNFGLTSILASVDARSLGILSGAGLSGELNTRMRLNFGVEEIEPRLFGGTIGARIVSQLSAEKNEQGRAGKVLQGRKYA
ncbi:hypothetical protein LCI18_006656 [Fusarium solani-melongenae]|uniref:Uncharacterized protein n=1 Tax=Fusarium solani subsp. cucurbitae TaxID=2747967 RepID=A0ACD3Z4F7_FUSSC|nr:hypothetical protein LCI18_006656 [Fusarium solani-melongenae]